MALLSGIALSAQLLARYGRRSKNPDRVSVLRVRTAWLLASLPSPASHALHPLAPYCYTYLQHYCPPLPYAPSSLGLPLVRDPFL